MLQALPVFGHRRLVRRSLVSRRKTSRRKTSRHKIKTTTPKQELTHETL